MQVCKKQNPHSKANTVVCIYDSTPLPSPSIPPLSKLIWSSQVRKKTSLNGPDAYQKYQLDILKMEQ